MAVGLSEHFTYKKLIRFVAPCIAMMIVTSVYSIVDGYFISNFAGKNAFAAVNLIMPVLMALGSFGFMIGTGGSALVAFTLGTGYKERANDIFSMLIQLITVVGISLSAFGIALMPQIARLLRASDVIFADCVLYGRILLLALTFFMLQNCFQSFLVTAERAGFGFVISVACGLLNMVLDYVLVYIFKWGITGAGLATVLSQALGGIIPLIFFLRKNHSRLHLKWVRFDFRLIGKACANGSSEMLTNLSTSLIGILYNLQLMRYAAENGIAAYGVVMYVSFIFIAVFFGYSIATGPLIGYQYGAGKQAELKNLFRKSLCFITVVSIVLTLSAEIFADPIARLFVGYDAELLAMTKKAMALYSLSFLICGFNVFASAFFTGLGNGTLSALISVLRTLVIEVASVLLLPLIWGIDGVWMAIVVAESVTLFVSGGLLLVNKKKYGY